ncbi:MAG: DUF2829 domain-containing protein [Dehalococcoidia bacterium]|jgi:hypothetical protein
MDFSDALEALKNGYRVYNKCWNGPDMYLELQRPDEHSKMGLPYIFINMPKEHPLYPDKKVPWLASQLDMMSEGWEVCGPME